MDVSEAQLQDAVGKLFAEGADTIDYSMFHRPAEERHYHYGIGDLGYYNFEHPQRSGDADLEMQIRSRGRIVGAIHSQ